MTITQTRTTITPFRGAPHAATALVPVTGDGFSGIRIRPAHGSPPR